MIWLSKALGLSESPAFVSKDLPQQHFKDVAA